jgi:hypothetical protein
MDGAYTQQGMLLLHFSVSEAWKSSGIDQLHISTAPAVEPAMMERNALG